MKLIQARWFGIISIHRIKTSRSFMYSLSLLVMLGLIVSCGKKSQQADPSNDQLRVPELREMHDNFSVQKGRKVELNQDLSNLEEFKRSLNDYVVSIAPTHGDMRGAEVVCRLRGAKTKTVTKRNFGPAGKKAILPLSVPNNAYDAIYDCSVMDRGPEIEIIEVELLKSLIVKDSRNISALFGTRKVQTVILEEGGTLRSDGENVNLSISELVSLGGKIITLSEEGARNAIPLRNGRPGGRIVLDVESAYGKLLLELRGGNAGLQTNQHGPLLPPPPQTARGTCRGYVPPRDRHLCIGPAGLPGVNGKRGDPGFDGGESGSIFLRVINPTELKLHVAYSPGAGSAGGPGQLGGPGGKGGPGSITLTDEPGDRGRVGNIQHPAGLDGPKGQDGGQGIAGIPGKHSVSHINLNGEIKYISSDWKNFEDEQ
jgi:hypothetical protein